MTHKHPWIVQNDHANQNSVCGRFWSTLINVKISDWAFLFIRGGPKRSRAHSWIARHFRGRFGPTLYNVKISSIRDVERASVHEQSNTYPQGRSSSYESRRGQLSVESCLRPAFSMRQLIVASRLGRTEYQLLLMKISWWDRNVKIRYRYWSFGCDIWIFYFVLLMVSVPLSQK